MVHANKVPLCRVQRACGKMKKSEIRTCVCEVHHCEESLFYTMCKRTDDRRTGVSNHTSTYMYTSMTLQIVLACKRTRTIRTNKRA